MKGGGFFVSETAPFFQAELEAHRQRRVDTSNQVDIVEFLPMHPYVYPLCISLMHIPHAYPLCISLMHISHAYTLCILVHIPHASLCILQVDIMEFLEDWASNEGLDVLAGMGVPRPFIWFEPEQPPTRTSLSHLQQKCLAHLVHIPCAYPLCISLMHVPCAYPLCMSLMHIPHAYPSCISLMHVPNAYPLCISLTHIPHAYPLSYPFCISLMHIPHAYP